LLVPEERRFITEELIRATGGVHFVGPRQHDGTSRRAGSVCGDEEVA
jgi:hypothetical protein